MKNLFFATTAAAIALLAVSCGGQNTSTVKELIGVGATFPEPFYTMVFNAYKNKSGITVSYSGMGSGEGIRSLKEKSADFVGSDTFLNDEEMLGMPEVTHIPTCMGAVVLGYNLPNIGEIRLSGPILADIFAGRITRWNDVRIAALNPLVKLPEKEIIPISRSDESGTTHVFTHYLCQVSEEWKSLYSESKSVNIPCGQSAKGNAGVAELIGHTPYSIGYICSEYAFAQHIPTVTLQNSSGQFVKPTIESIKEAAQTDIHGGLLPMITNSGNRNAYPIACLTWLVVYKEQNYGGRTRGQAQALAKLIEFLLSPLQQQSAATIDYAPLPRNIANIGLERLKQLTYDGTPIMGADKE